ncbi:MAG: hypothetical protein BGN99_17750 [Alphaproteobacteria bacterium 65-37]|jgi:hypothetical protein|nr:MAG: hypothetical protein BGN99_17750 [Alphaproteobacteria bacterium 65-37]
MARQGAPNNFLGNPGCFDELFNVEASGDAHFFTHESEVLGAYVACCSIGCRERAASETGYGSIELSHAKLKAR